MKASINNYISRTERGDYSLGFVVSKDWDYMPFAVNVNVNSPRRSTRAVISLAVNPAHEGFDRAIKIARTIDSPRKALELLEKIRHAMFDHYSMPDNVHSAVIGNIGRLSLAHATHSVNIVRPDILPVLFPVLQEYDARTVQQFPDQHRQALMISSNQLVTS